MKFWFDRRDEIKWLIAAAISAIILSGASVWFFIGESEKKREWQPKVREVKQENVTTWEWLK